MPAAFVSALRRAGRVLAAGVWIVGSGCDEHPPEERIAVVQQQAPYPGDPHVFACAECHASPATPAVPAAPAANWRATCTRSGCHPQAWTRTIFHRVDPDVFTNCTNCHFPHTWVAAGSDCGTCHASVLGPEGTLAARALPGAPTFPHDRHQRLACATCHRLDTRHADLLIRDVQQCTACHHGPPATAACTTCHERPVFAGVRTRTARLQLRAWPAARDRDLPFDHSRHERFECERCHEQSATWSPRDNCASCHAEHHGAEAACIDCHAAPPHGAHALDVHTSSCRGCHGPESADAMQMTRNFCLACHQNQVRHMPGGNCADCHRLTPGIPAGPGGRP